MAITDLPLSETIDAGAPSIKYTTGDIQRGNDQGDQLKLLAQQIWDSLDMNQKSQFGTFEQFYTSGAWKQILAQLQQQEQGPQGPQGPQGLQAQAPLQPQQELRMAYGGIAGLGGRRRYGLGSKFKKFIRKIIPNELATVASMAAPFVAPFNPIAGGLMAGFGGFDRHGSLGRGLKSGLMTYGLGQGARYLGGAGMQKGFNPMGGMGAGQGAWSSPLGAKSGLGKWFGGEQTATGAGVGDGSTLITTAAGEAPVTLKQMQDFNKIAPTTTVPGKIFSSIGKFIKDNAKLAILGSMALAYGITAKDYNEDDIMEMARGAKMDIAGIRKEVEDAYLAGEDAWNELKKKYPYIGDFETKKAEGGRIGFDNGGFTMGDALANEEKRVRESHKAYERYKASGGKKSYALFIKMTGVGGFAQGGRIGYRLGRTAPYAGGDDEEEDLYLNFMARRKNQGSRYSPSRSEYERYVNTTPMFYGGGLRDQRSPEELRMERAEQGPGKFAVLAAQGGRIGAQEGGLMDLGGMEKDYRDDGGFVPLGEEEKADDVPARLSKNEFVFTADAVRAAGGGDVDQGAEIMENVMKNLEQGGQISEESQGLSGAREMFDVSERLSEVI